MTEFWIITIMVYKLIEKGKYARPELYQIDEIVQLGIFEDLTVSLAGVFKEK